MIAVLLGILKILGLVLLILLGLVLLVVLLVLLVPVRYRAEGSFAGKVKGTAGASWLLHLVSCQVSYEEELAFRVRIFGFPLRLWDRDEAEEDGGGAESEPDGQFAEAARPEPAGASAKAAEPVGRYAGTAAAEPEEDMAEMLLEAQEAKSRKAECQKESAGPARSGQPDPREPVLEKAAPETPKKGCSIGTLCDKLKKKAAGVRRKLSDMQSHAERIREKLLQLKEKKNLIFAFLQDEENKKAFSLGKRKVLALLRHVLPKKLAGRIRFGFDDPSTTGTVLMYAAPFYGLYARHLELIPDFEETGIEGDLRLSGRIRLGCLLFLGGQLLLNRNFRRLLRKLKKLRRELGWS